MGERDIDRVTARLMRRFPRIRAWVTSMFGPPPEPSSIDVGIVRLNVAIQDLWHALRPGFRRLGRLIDRAMGGEG